MADWYDSAKDYANSVSGEQHSSFARAFEAYWRKLKASAGAIVTPVTAQANLGAAPTASDFNTLLANLKSAGVLK